MASNPPDNSPHAIAAFSYLAGPRIREEIPVRATAVTIGQGADNEVVLDDDTVSTTHARLEYVDGAWRLTDLGSSNGTRVEGVRLAPDVPTPLSIGSAVHFGGVRMQFRADERVDAERLVEEPPSRAAAAAPARVSSGFRLPVWVLVLLILLVAIAVGLFVWLGGPADIPGPPVDAISQIVAGPPLSSAA
jgi:hypothetical protein